MPTTDGNKPVSKRILWFKARRYGWGWTPASWQGWLITILYIILLTISAFFLLPHSSGGTFSTVKFVIFLMFAMSLTFILIGLCFGWGEAPGWRWGDKKEDEHAAD